MHLIIAYIIIIIILILNLIPSICLFFFSDGFIILLLSTLINFIYNLMVYIGRYRYLPTLYEDDKANKLIVFFT